MTMRHSPLLAQAGPETELDFAPSPWRLKQCQQTGFVFLANPPAYSELEETYAYERTFALETRARRAAEPLRYAVSMGLKRFRNRVLRRNKTLGLMLDAIANSPSQQINVLDVGCGWGSLLSDTMDALPPPLRARAVPHGIEISRELAQISQRKLEAFGGRCVHAPSLDAMGEFGPDFFDVIVMASYLEHEIEPLQVLRAARARLKTGGQLIVKVPNYACVNRRLRGARWCGFRWPDHVNYFTPATLLGMSYMAGLRLVRMSFRDRNPLSDNMYAVFSR
ncbi:MAG: class I SAM-dependent methyltransferase [Pseudomonadota bacterium]